MGGGSELDVEGINGIFVDAPQILAVTMGMTVLSIVSLPLDGSMIYYNGRYPIHTHGFESCSGEDYVVRNRNSRRRL